MTAYQKYDRRYKRGGCTKEQLQELVELGVLTAEEYKQITCEDYDNETN